MFRLRALLNQLVKELLARELKRWAGLTLDLFFCFFSGFNHVVINALKPNFTFDLLFFIVKNAVYAVVILQIKIIQLKWKVVQILS